MACVPQGQPIKAIVHYHHGLGGYAGSDSNRAPSALPISQALSKLVFPYLGAPVRQAHCVVRKRWHHCGLHCIAAHHIGLPLQH